MASPPNPASPEDPAAERRRLQAEAKARLRQESLARHLARPIEERLAAALALILPSERCDRDRR